MHMCCFTIVFLAFCLKSCLSYGFDHMVGTSRLVQIFVNNHYLQVTSNGLINGANYVNDNLLYSTTFKRFRTSNFTGIQNVATCMYVCLDRCGHLYTSKKLSRDCMFTETIEENNYTTFSRIDKKLKSYLAINRKGKPKKVQIFANETLGKFHRYASILLNFVQDNYTNLICKKKKRLFRHRKCKF